MIFRTIPKINKILYNINLETNFNKLNISSNSTIEKGVSNINAQRLNNNPVPLSVNSIREILVKRLNHKTTYIFTNTIYS